MPSKQQVVSFVEGVATVAAIALLMFGVAVGATAGRNDAGASGSQGESNRIVSKAYGTVSEVRSEPGRGKTVYNYDSGVTYTITGNSIVGSDGSRYQVRGNQVVSSTGELYERIGSVLLQSSDGRVCQLLGNAMTCN